ncbi:Start control protein cdc10 OS=Schizosaccharomyces pombe (strain 972 / ATCC 24843) GN=cdc10 PE=1 SV=1 [Rhizoctonia solani AG-1 IB]|uniref:Start control protein cdc10 n=1 Tax=Thanatephorus cucumeris (strain AG1-IB / isolate 7/3/14) TaxID=1108050 RepID=A0A0B7FIX9_THACB|nr:Start control protein cdc10 OS=Schizosaccharomyces pombe (strain 972 / ATCC 24843) GN=cdc10 PE=1 SV=1 [Rhizoctonia solani AG-1 IB]
MAATGAFPGGQTARVYNAVYSSVQVFECMVRGIAVMRRRSDSYVNATQILKVAGIDKGRRTKILEKEILPGKHEIVQGGYGKYQGTWIPLERGRDVAAQYGVASLLGPLFDYVPAPAPLHPRPLGTAAHGPTPGSNSQSTGYSFPPAPIVSPLPPTAPPGSALRLLAQGRAQGLFTPSTLASSHPPNSPPHSGQLPGPSPHHSPPDPILASSSDSTVSRQHSRRPSNSATVIGVPNVKRPRPHEIPSPAPSIMPTNDGDLPPNKRQRMLPVLGPSLSDTWPPPILAAPAAIISKTPPAPSQASHPQWATVKHDSPKGGRARAVLLAIYSDAEPTHIIQLLTAAAPPDEVDINLVLDEHGNTPLHWASSLARISHVEALLAAGADVQRGNAAGETPLMRTVLSVSSTNDNAISSILPLLSPSLRTLDSSHRSVLHHIAEVAGVKGRAASARMYMEAVLEWVARNQGGEFKTFVDLQDENGDTALCVAARVGNRALVRMLVDVGADRGIANKLGLRPGDFGVEGQNLQVGSMEEVLSALRSRPSAPIQRSQDIIHDLTSMIQSLTADFHAEIKSKQDSLDVAQAHLRAATRELADQRRHIAAAQARLASLDQARQRARNVSRTIKDEVSFDWTGRTEVNGTPAHASRGVAFQYRGPSSMLAADTMAPTEDAPRVDITAAAGEGTANLDISPSSLDVDPPLPAPGNDTIATLVRLRRLKMWHTRIEELVRERMDATRGAGAEKEFQCKKIVSLCTGVPVDRIESMLENLLIAVESDGQGVDLNRVAGFMQKVRDGGL